MRPLTGLTSPAPPVFGAPGPGDVPCPLAGGVVAGEVPAGPVVADGAVLVVVAGEVPLVVLAGVVPVVV